MAEQLEAVFEPLTLPCRADHLAERIVDGELVLYDPKRQYVHVLNPTAAFVWTACDGKRDQAGIISALTKHYPESRESIERDVVETLGLFLAEGLLKR